MKKLINILLAALMAANFSSCKEEDDNYSPGNGGVLTGVWSQSDDETGYRCIQISADGRMQPIKYGENSANAIGIIKQIGEQTMIVKTEKGECTVGYAMDNVLTVRDGKIGTIPVMTLITSELNQGDVSYSGTYMKDLDNTPGATLDPLEYDDALIGEWEDQFSNSTIIFGNDGSYTEVIGLTNNYQWGIYKGKLYRTMPGASSYRKYDSYKVEGNTLTLTVNGVVFKYVRKGTEKIVGNGGVMAGYWLKLNSDGTPFVFGKFYFGVKVEENGYVTVIKQNIQTGEIMNSNVNSEFIVTSVVGNDFNGVDSNGSVNGSFTLNVNFSITDNGVSGVTKMEITKFSAPFGLVSSSICPFVGTYEKVKNIDGTLARECKDSRLVRYWTRDVDSSFEYMNLKEDGTGYILDVNSDISNYYWGAAMNKLLMFNKNTFEYKIFDYNVYGNTLTIVTPEGTLIYTDI